MSSASRTALFLQLLVASLTIATPDSTVRAQHNRYVLTSVQKNIDVGDWRIDARKTGVAPGVPWSVRRWRLHGGKQDGVDLIAIDNGKLTITLVPTRGMGILHVV